MENNIRRLLQYGRAEREGPRRDEDNIVLSRVFLEMQEPEKFGINTGT